MTLDLLILKEQAERKLREAEDAKDIDAFNLWYSELMRIRELMDNYPLG